MLNPSQMALSPWVLSGCDVLELEALIWSSLLVEEAEEDIWLEREVQWEQGKNHNVSLVENAEGVYQPIFITKHLG